MNNFQFYNPARIIFGKDTEKDVASYVKKYGKKVLLHYGGGSIKQSGLYDVIIQNLHDNQVDFVELGGVVPNPVLSKVEEGIDVCRKENVDFILAVGGGSVIDTAKAFAIGVKSNLNVWDYYYDNSNVIVDALNIGCVLTIAAAGSESSPASVITDESSQLKRYVNSEHIIPKFAILNPELTSTLPPYQTACGASDILAHLFERYFSPTEHVDLTDRLLEAAISTILKFAPIAYNEPNNYEARAEIMWCGTVAHNNILSTGRQTDWASHNIEHEISGIYDLAHGAGLSIIFPAWMKYVYKEQINKFVQLARRVFNIKDDSLNKELVVNTLIIKIENWYKSINLPIRLSEIDIDDQNFELMSKKALDGRESLGALKKLNSSDVFKIYELAL